MKKILVQLTKYNSYPVKKDTSSFHDLVHKLIFKPTFCAIFLSLFKLLPLAFFLIKINSWKTKPTFWKYQNLSGERNFSNLVDPNAVR